jgi:hypothetical protein
VVLEPTDLGLMVGGVGVLWIDVRVVAFSGHAQSADTHANAIDLGMRLVGGLRHGTGTVSNDIGFGESIGLEAAWQPMSVGQRLGWAVSWSLLWSWFGSQPAARITGTLDLIELDLAVRARFAPTPVPGRILTVGVGGMLLRSNERLPPDDRRNYLGAFVEVGYEHLAYGTMTGTLHVRLGPVPSGPTIVSALLGIGIAL